MLSLRKKMCVEYNFLVMKMVEDNGNIENVTFDCELICDVETLLNLACNLLCLESMQGFFKVCTRAINLHL
jgi:hypothetical protein